LWGHGSLSECNKCTSSWRRHIVHFSCPLSKLRTRQNSNKNKSKRRTAGQLEQEPDVMSHFTIVPLVFAIQAVFYVVARLIVLSTKASNPRNLNNTHKLLVGTLRQAGRASTDGDKLPRKYSLVPPPTTTANTCRKKLVLELDCVALPISPYGCIQLLHHIHWDKPMPVYIDGSNNLWTLPWPPLTTVHNPQSSRPRLGR
jgi:hypothetical protein